MTTLRDVHDAIVAGDLTAEQRLLLARLVAVVGDGPPRGDAQLVRAVGDRYYRTARERYDNLITSLHAADAETDTPS